LLPTVYRSLKADVATLSLINNNKYWLNVK
jgi:hypothetical protein